MASVLDICNLALSRLGDDATVSNIDPPEGSMQAEHCARFYPLARDTILTMHEWGFASTGKSLAPMANVEYGTWQFAYSLPVNCLKVVRVAGPGSDDDANYVIGSAPDGSGVLFCNQEKAVLVYVARIADSARYPALFVDALAWLLASHLAGPLIKGDTGASMAQQAYQAYLGALQRAVLTDVQQHRPVRPRVKTPWIEDR